MSAADYPTLRAARRMSWVTAAGWDTRESRRLTLAPNDQLCGASGNASRREAEVGGG
jgi:hypothetical protein